ncbi:hypothetical protein EKH77_23880 [Streptomyces luteoverticillatus]|uniref:Uncharacterized protein n=1 Tax=Streptomyces luteoverticillatus TaxID=66425 RepID=A0A3S9PND3_STRLT|nr:hypothetical protein [Streptomyces luteoverticillatus]AZQ73850.1 hypothetical protein EKH77_23880 [Streptomyces luteoverticillatus]
MNAHLAKEAETLTTFKNRIDEVLANLEKSAASPKTMGDQKVAHDAFGKGFGSAEGLAALYDAVHARLETLSKVFGDQVEAMGLAAVIAERGYDGVDADEAARMRAIQERTHEYERGTTPRRPGQTAPGTLGAAGAEGTGGAGL